MSKQDAMINSQCLASEYISVISLQVLTSGCISSKTHNFTSPDYLPRFPVLGMIFLLLKGV